ncbi:transporter [Agromyces protaetiae]|uniref:Transporter n=1 Tax=Agromyces protaetiae TaxID=2509455 RepID=A0A4V0YGW7_9MICO|nr:TOBE domain-containing protein [Agromyces protaetiae]QAY72651.1 transporter [Agromyces protaetiae]
MQTSARNRFEGTVSAVKPGAVNDEIELTLAGGERLSAVVTHESAVSLGLAVGAEAVALVKAPWIVLVTDAAGYRFSARNQFSGAVIALTRGAVNTVVDVTSGDLVISAVVTNDSVDSLGLAEGVAATAIFKASNVILATRA